MVRERDAAHTQVLPVVGADTRYGDCDDTMFDEFVSDPGDIDGTDSGDADDWDGPRTSLSTTAVLCVVAAVLAGVVALTFVMMNQMIAALPAPASPRTTVTETELSTHLVTTVETTTETTTASPTRERSQGRDRVTSRNSNTGSRAAGGAGGQASRKRPAQQTEGKEPVEATAPIPLPSQGGTDTLARRFGDGAVMAGRDVVEGTYRNSGGSGTCEWTFRRGSEVVDSGRTTKTFAIDLADDGVVFISRGCGTWEVSE